jgi:hypothetical protein
MQKRIGPESQRLSTEILSIVRSAKVGDSQTADGCHTSDMKYWNSFESLARLDI